MLLSGLFILDLLVIHPFGDGNGRVARLLTGALLGEHGYTVGRYVSLEQEIAESADAYYQALLDSTHGWHEATADPWAWLGYFTSMIASAYAVFADRAAAARTPGTKQERVREHILRHAPATFRLADIRTAVPGVSDQTIRLALEQLRGEGKVRADGTGRSATWTRIPNTTLRIIARPQHLGGIRQRVNRRGHPRLAITRSCNPGNAERTE